MYDNVQPSFPGWPRGTAPFRRSDKNILSAPDGSLLKFKEDEQITENERLVFISEDYILVTVFDDEEKSYEVYMNYVVKESKEKKKN